MILWLACAPPLVPPEVVEDPHHDWDLDGMTEADGDCDDADASAAPGVVEVCDGVDNDCDGRVDEDDAADAVVWFQDLDGDGFGFGERAACRAPAGFVAIGGDCEDQDASVHPDADEVCDGVDNDCDGEADGGSADAATWYLDADGDGYGDPSTGEVACSPSAGFVDNDDDCDDASDAAFPGHPELCGDGLDNDCSGDASPVCLGGDVGDAQRLDGLAGGEQVGHALAGVGDWTEDGLADLVVASPGRDTTDQQSGALELFAGPASEGTTLTDAVWTLAGESKNAELGAALAVSDGALWVGAPGHQLAQGETTWVGVGAAYLVASDTSSGRLSEQATAWAFGGAEGDRFGSAAVFLDQRAVIGAPGATWGDDDPGLVYLFDELPSGELDPAEADVVWGEGIASYTGSALAALDLDADGLTDLAVGAPGRRTWGSVYVVHGPVGDQLASDGQELQGPDGGDFGSTLLGWDHDGDGAESLWIGAPGVDGVYLGSQAMLEAPGLGSGLERAGDLDGDGIQDLLAAGAGSVWVVFGGPDVSLGPELMWTEGDLGAAMAGLDDLDGDGLDDLALGAPQHGAGQEGVVLLLRGATDWTP